MIGLIGRLAYQIDMLCALQDGDAMSRREDSVSCMDVTLTGSLRQYCTAILSCHDLPSLSGRCGFYTRFKVWGKRCIGLIGPPSVSARVPKHELRL